MRTCVKVTAFVAGMIAAACGLSITGEDGAESSPDGGGASLPSKNDVIDGEALSDDGGVAGDLDDAGEELQDAGETPIADASAPDADGGCGPTTLTDNFASGLSQWSIYGPVVVEKSGGGNSFARLTSQNSTASGIFWTPQARAKEAKVSFQYRIDTNRQSNVGDGMTLTWLSSTGGVNVGTNAIAGGSLAEWPLAVGYAFAIDAYKNSNLGDNNTPFFGVLKLDPTRGKPGDYDWHVYKTSAYTGVYNTWRTVTASVLAGKVNAVVSTTKVVSNVSVSTDLPMVAIGFTASTGGANPITADLDTVTIELVNPVCP